jgi:hypothetical protein
MADARELAKNVVQMSELQDARVEVTSDQKLLVEFRIDDLVKTLVPGGGLVASCCAGCHGCSGCSM